MFFELNGWAGYTISKVDAGDCQESLGQMISSSKIADSLARIELLVSGPAEMSYQCLAHHFRNLV